MPGSSEQLTSLSHACVLFQVRVRVRFFEATDLPLARLCSGRIKSNPNPNPNHNANLPLASLFCGPIKHEAEIRIAVGRSRVIKGIGLYLQVRVNVRVRVEFRVRDLT